MTIRWIAVIAAILTLLLPTDLVPDLVPILGWLDDLLGILVLVYQVVDTVRERRSKKLGVSKQLPKGR